jgi:outer membrane protein assembly factor BamB
VANGKRRWKEGRYGHGQVIVAADRLVVQAESGEVVLVEATPDGHKELGRVQALTGKAWTVPTLAGRYLLVRNDHEAACYEVALR